MKTKQIILSTALAMVSAFGMSNPSAAVITPIDPNITLTPCLAGVSAGQVKALGRSELFTVNRDYSCGIEDGVSYPAGTFGATPLFKTSFKAGAKSSSCVIANLSVNAQPNDNAMVFQVRIDGKPMAGHWNPKDFLNSLGFVMPSDYNVPIVWLPNVVGEGGFAGIDPPHIASYMFFANVKPGTHTIEVVAAGCCHADIDTPAGTPDGYIRSATLTIQYSEPAALAAELATEIGQRP